MNAPPVAPSPFPAANELIGQRVISVRGARTHNLQNVSVDLPLGQLIVMTGVSGSGKSSLAIDTLFAEGQRRYLESVSIQTRSLLQQLPRPDVDDISGLPPAVSVDQRVSAAPARSTLAVTAEIYDYLRLLYSRAGIAHCTQCQKPVSSHTVEQIVSRTLNLPDRSRLMILSPMVRNRKGAHQEVLERIGRNGFVRARIDGELTDVADFKPLAPNQRHTIEAVIDRIVMKEGIQPRLRESIELACRESEGTCLICLQQDSGWSEVLWSIRFRCADCDLTFPAPEPRIFSFQTATGVCPACKGLGAEGFLESRNDTTVFGRKPCSVCHGSRLQPFASGLTFLEMPLADFTAQTIDAAILTTRRWMSQLQSDASPAPLSSGSSLTHESQLVADRTLPDILARLECLQQMGIGYLTLDRSTASLSGGEYQRTRLAACLGSGLHGACFVLDEPTAGLHPRDTQRLLQTLRQIRDRGATVVVVEHDGDLMRAADWLVDLGPGAGADGGNILFSGTPSDAARTAVSPTGSYLRGELTQQAGHGAAPEVPSEAEAQTSETIHAEDAQSCSVADQPVISIQRASLNNLCGVDVEFPLRRLVCVTGVSGSGKSSLVMDTLLPLAQAQCSDSVRTDTKLLDVCCGGVTGLEYIQRVVALDSSPLGRTSRSCIATVSGVWDYIRRLFAKTREARSRGWGSLRFSFNSGDGRCPECRGTGVRNLQMKFLPDAAVPCASCRGRRFRRLTLGVRFKGRNAAEVLAMRIDEAVDFFSEIESIHRVLSVYRTIGLGYLSLGQSASTFSGGEAQRVRLAAELAELSGQHTLYILDEPTAGLHPADVCRLLAVLKQLVAAENSVIVVEHSLQMMQAADWLIDLGPDRGAFGGRLVFSGLPQQMISEGQGYTADALRNARRQNLL